MKTLRYWCIFLLISIFLLNGCATTSARDPFEPINRVIFQFNDSVDTHIAQPIAKGYQFVMPKPIQTAISNFFSNISDFNNFGNNLLQLRFTAAAEDLMRIAINTVFGLGGLIDFATAAGLPKHNQSFGLTLGAWGIPSGPYIVLPLFGPSTIRNGIGLGVDLNVTMLNVIQPSIRNPLFATQFVSARTDMLNATDILNAAALDPYSFVRDAYLGQQKQLLHPIKFFSGDAQNASATSKLPEYNDPESNAESTNNASSEKDLPQYIDPAPAQ